MALNAAREALSVHACIIVGNIANAVTHAVTRDGVLVFSDCGFFMVFFKTKKLNFYANNAFYVFFQIFLHK